MQKNPNKKYRIASSISRNISDIILFELKNSVFKLVSVNQVTVSSDNSFAKIYVSHLDGRKIDEAVEELNAILAQSFDFDNFKTQQEKGILIKEKFRADGLHRVLYKCPHCQAEGQTEGLGIHLTCHACGAKYELTEQGFLKNVAGETLFHHIPDWYRWERECVKRELEEGTYKLDVDVDIYMLVNTSCIYKVGFGRLTHTAEGFHLTGCDGQLDFIQSPLTAHSLNADFYWYEIGDMICVGDEKVQYYCFPKNAGNVVAKTRMATEELYKLLRRTPKSK